MEWNCVSMIVNEKHQGQSPRISNIQRRQPPSHFNYEIRRVCVVRARETKNREPLNNSQSIAKVNDVTLRQ